MQPLHARRPLSLDATTPQHGARNLPLRRKRDTRKKELDGIA
jgi:hypothetical protein